jgi:hypothetical protein
MAKNESNQETTETPKDEVSAPKTEKVITATLIEGKVYAIGSITFLHGVPQRVTAEQAEYLKEQSISVTIHRGEERTSEARPRFLIEEKEVDIAEAPKARFSSPADAGSEEPAATEGRGRRR